ncbi:MAG: hypothetical protein NTV81_01420 [Candidatus Komeilibacteria bacterium]|nr:hypothetical protein [Candidatus Komeilibacteria bacterium]
MIIFVLALIALTSLSWVGSAYAQNTDNIAIECVQGGTCARPATGLLQFLGGQKQTWLMLTVAGLIDGINPCAIGTLILLLGYLMIFAKKEKLMLPLGSVYIITIFVTYFFIGIIFSEFASRLLNWTAYPIVSQVFKIVVLALIALAGLLNLKDYFWYQKGLSLGISKKQSGIILKYLEKLSFPTVIILGVLVTLFELPCSLPIYIGSVTILTGLFTWAKVLVYLLWYNFMFIVPILVIFIGLLWSKRIFEVKDWQERSNRYMKLMLGLSQIVIAVALYFL